MAKTWIFTFGAGHVNAGHYVKIDGNYNTARDTMNNLFGDKWAFQYSEEDWSLYTTKAAQAFHDLKAIETEIPLQEAIDNVNSERRKLFEA